MSLVTVGTVAFDSIETPSGKADRVVGGAASNLPEDEEDVYQDMIRQAEGDDADELVTFTKTAGVEEPSDAFLDDNDSDDDLL